MKNLLLFIAAIILFSSLVSAQTQIATDDFECNDFSCGKGWNNIWSYTGRCEITTFGNPLGKYQMRGLSGCDAIRNVDTTGFTAVNVSFYATATSLENDEYCRYYYFDGKTNHEIVTLTNGQDDGKPDLYTVDITKYGLNANAGIRMYGSLSTGDYCYIDDVKLSGVTVADLNIFTKDIYLTGNIEVIEATSSITNALHTIELKLPDDTIFCTDTIMSPPTAYTTFAIKCTMPTLEYIDAKAVMYFTADPLITSTINYFNITNMQQVPSSLQINKVYFSPQVLQGGQTEIYAVLDTNLSIKTGTVTVNFPDGTTRLLGMYPTINTNEYRALITDTYLTGNVGFIIRFESGNFYTRYSGSYNVIPFSVDYVAAVGKVDSVSSVDKINVTRMTVHGTEYYAGQRGKVFVQMLDGSDSPINDSTCYTSIYYPNDQVWKYQQLMNYVDEGLYVFSFDTPYTDGVYPVTAYCTIPAINISSTLVEDDFNSGSVSGGTGWSNSWTLDSCYYESVNVYEGAYSLECYNDRDPYREFLSNDSFISLDYSFYWRGDSLESADTVRYVLKDASNTKFVLKTISDGDDDGQFHLETGTLYANVNNFNFSGTLKFAIETNNNLGNGDFYNVDKLDINLNEEIIINGTEYQTVRGTGEVHVSSDINYDAILEKGEMTNETFLNSFIFHLHFTSLTSQNLTGQLIDITLWKPFPCSHVMYVQEQYENGTVVNLTYTGKIDDSGRCVIRLEHKLNFGESYDIEVVSENYWREKLYEDYATLLLEQEMINVSCQNYRLANNFPSFNINYSVFTDGQDNLWKSCASYLDKSDNFLNEVQEFFNLDNYQGNFTFEEMESLESNWLHLIDIKDDTNYYANTIFNSLNLGSSYSFELINDSHLPINPGYVIYLANISTTYINYLEILGIPSNTWNYGVRNLTYYPPASVNTTAVAIDVWNYTDRQLTYYPPAEVNNTAVAEEVWFWQGVINGNIPTFFTNYTWNYTARYTHGEDLT